MCLCLHVCVCRAMINEFQQARALEPPRLSVSAGSRMNFTAPHVVPGYEPGIDGPKSPDERAEILSNMKQMRLVQAGIESPVAKAVMSGGMGEL